MEILNLKMLALLQAAGITWPLDPRLSPPSVVPVVEVIKDCVFLKSEYDRNKDRAKLESFPDKTELESFINHVHLPFTGTRESLLSCLSYAASLREALMALTQSHRFRVELSISDNDGS